MEGSASPPGAATPTSPPPSPAVQTSALLTWLQPTPQSDEHRLRIFTFLRSSLLGYLPHASVVLCGSTSSKTYLPDANLDVAVFAADRSADNLLLTLLTGLCEAAVEAKPDSRRPAIRQVQLLNSSPRSVKCLVENVPVSIVANGPHHVGLSPLLEFVDVAVGRRHLFKRSLLLVKAWMSNDSPKYTGGLPLLLGGAMSLASVAATTTLSAPAVAILLLHLFCVHPSLSRRPAPPTVSPITVLRIFFDYYKAFDWGKDAVAATHVERLHGGATATNAGSRKPHLSPDTLAALVSGKIAALQREIALLPGHGSEPPPLDDGFSFKCCRIRDPLRIAGSPGSNLGEGLNASSLSLLVAALDEAGKQLAYYLGQDGGGYGSVGGSSHDDPRDEDDSKDDGDGDGGEQDDDGGQDDSGAVHISADPQHRWFLHAFFPSAYGLSSCGECYRPDIISHPCQPWSEVSPRRMSADECREVFEADGAALDNALLSPKPPPSAKVGGGGGGGGSDRPGAPPKNETTFEEEKKCSAEPSSERKGPFAASDEPCLSPPKPNGALTTPPRSLPITTPSTSAVASSSSAKKARSKLVNAGTQTPSEKAAPSADVADAAVGSAAPPPPNAVATPQQHQSSSKKGGRSSASVSAQPSSKSDKSTTRTPSPQASSDGGGGRGGTITKTYPVTLLLAAALFVAVIAACVAAFLPAGVGSATPAPLIATTTLPHWVRLGETISLGNVIPKRGDLNLHLEADSFQWKKNGVALDGEIKSFLTLSEATDDTEGVYSCIFFKGGKAVGQLNTEIRVSEKPVVKKNAGYYKVTKDTKFMLSVSSSGLPTPEFQWRLNGFEIPGASQPNYVIQSIDFSDAGTYTCDVYNVAGSVLWEEAIVTVVDDYSSTR